MAKSKVTLQSVVLHWFTYHPWLKLIALALAALTWFYVKGEMDQFIHF